MSKYKKKPLLFAACAQQTHDTPRSIFLRAGLWAVVPFKKALSRRAADLVVRTFAGVLAGHAAAGSNPAPSPTWRVHARRRLCGRGFEPRPFANTVGPQKRRVVLQGSGFGAGPSGFWGSCAAPRGRVACAGSLGTLVTSGFVGGCFWVGGCLPQIGGCVALWV